MNILQKILDSPHKNKHGVYISKIYFYHTIYNDENIFFTALMASILRNIKHSFLQKDQILIDEILKNCKQSFNFYKNKHGGLTYSFYPTKPSVSQYTGIPFLNRFKAIYIPDDLDSTSTIYLAKGTSNQQELIDIKRKLESLSYDGKPLTSIPKKHQQTKAYRTWFATKMKHDMDICVLCNVLTFVFSNQLLLTEVDEASISFLSDLIKNKELLTLSYIYAPHYKVKSIILYHVCRLLSVATHPKLTKLTPLVSKEIKTLLTKTTHSMEHVILTSSLYKIGETPTFDFKVDPIKFDSFFWFNANPFSMARPWIKKIIAQKNFLHLDYTCSDFYYVLILELQQISNASLFFDKNVIRLLKE